MKMSESVDFNLISMKNKVQFLNIKEQYNYGADLNFQFQVDDYTPEEGDRIGIFKVGWNSVRDYEIFEWVPLNFPENVGTIVFTKNFVCKIKFEEGDFFQLCYLGRESEIYGVSSPFQFIKEDSKIIISFSSGEVDIYPKHFTVDKATKVHYDEQNRKFRKIRDENIMLKERNKDLEEEVEMLKTALKSAQSQQAHDKNYDQEIASLQQTTKDLKKAEELRQSEIDMLKKKITEIKEVFIELSLEKKKVEKKYETLKRGQKEKSSKINEKLKENDSESKSNENLREFEIMNLISIPPFPIPQSMLKQNN
ncbi:calcium-binding and coiled-coil domain-containing protein 2-like [Diorhabda sublineata]|uniref:calcium-binding and coiled-coil domain-containing protein 2-like n=1 Tax=Diorhabda sublineata TaxID=1163346 RepID=UPI0024E0BDC8|nr:calcium-binding and coiled-coil domain-containing protein 2-like [Diorhabda sublineata]